MGEWISEENAALRALPPHVAPRGSSLHRQHMDFHIQPGTIWVSHVWLVPHHSLAMGNRQRAPRTEIDSCHHLNGGCGVWACFYLCARVQSWWLAVVQLGRWWMRVGGIGRLVNQIAEDEEWRIWQERRAGRETVVSCCGLWLYKCFFFF